MAKGQKRSNREAKKPKAAKAVVAAPSSPFQQKPAQQSPSKGQGK
jgi:hypothetical protein